MPPTPRRLGAGPCIGAADVAVAHTAQLERATLDAARRMVVAAFDARPVAALAGGFTDVDWEHALGGMHALVHNGEELVAHGSVIQRRFLHAGRSYRVGYVEAVAVAPSAQRRGHGGAVMAALEEVISRAYDFGALCATSDGVPLYRSRGWQLWRGPASALSPSGVTRTPEEDGDIYVFPGAAQLDLEGELTCDWRDGDLW